MKTEFLLCYISLFIGILLQCCGNRDISDRDDSSISASSGFDSLEHYSIAISPYKLGELEDKANKSSRESLLLTMLEGSQVDTSSLAHLLEIGYSKTEVDRSLYGSIDSLFLSNQRKDYLDSSCINQFRDILIFYRDNKCVGAVKICFDCKAMVSWSSDLKFDGFGDWEDYDKLYTILRSNGF